jgi:glycosyltransferase involved in cell wall biosynthesis
MTQTPVVATYHGIYSARSALKRWYNSVMTRGVAVIANSRFTRDHILAEHRVDPARIVVIPEGVDTFAFDPAAVCAERVAAVREGWGIAHDDARPVMLQAARLTGWKGQGVAIAALAAMARRDARLVLAGRAQSSQAKQALQAAAADAGVADRVVFAGEARDMPAAFLAADLVIAPTTAAESFGRSVAEAAAMERVVLASDLGAVRETLGEGRFGRLLAPGDPLAWARAMDQALDMPQAARGAIGAAARDHVVQEHSLATMCERTFALYAEVLEGRA